MRTLSRFALIGLIGGASAACSSDTLRLSDPFTNPFSASTASPEPGATGSLPEGEAVAAPLRASPIRSEALPAPGAGPMPLSGRATQAPQTAPQSPRVVASTAPVTSAAGGWTARGGTTITVGQGDTLNQLSTRFGVPTSAILSANGLSGASQITPGRQIVIPVYDAGGSAALTPRVAPAAPQPRMVLQQPKPESKPDSRPEPRRIEISKPEPAKAEPVRVASVEPTRKVAEAPERKAPVRPGQAAPVPVKPAAAERAAKLNTRPAEPVRTAKAEVKETKPEPKKPAEKVAAKPEPKPEPKPVAKVEPKPEPKAVAKAEPKPEPKPEPKKPVEKVAKLEAPKAKPEEPKAEAKKAVEAPKPVAKVEPPKVEPKPEPKAEPKPDPAPAAEEAAFRWPARGRVIAGYGSSGNEGINIALPEGTPVKAAEEGTVAYAGSDVKGYGKLVLVRHANGYVSAYAHNGEIEVRPGEKVKRGQTIAKSGSSGNVTSPQLHFEIRKGATPVDPIPRLASN
jgi:murein DD-endopeptidase MepM/ murein hydrolase activator NlpD